MPVRLEYTRLRKYRKGSLGRKTGGSWMRIFFIFTSFNIFLSLHGIPDRGITYGRLVDDSATRAR